MGSRITLKPASLITCAALSRRSAVFPSPGLHTDAAVHCPTTTVSLSINLAMPSMWPLVRSPSGTPSTKTTRLTPNQCFKSASAWVRVYPGFRAASPKVLQLRITVSTPLNSRLPRSCTMLTSSSGIPRYAATRWGTKLSSSYGTSLPNRPPQASNCQFCTRISPSSSTNTGPLSRIQALSFGISCQVIKSWSGLQPALSKAACAW